VYICRLGVSSHFDKTEKGLEELTQQSDCKTIIFKYCRPKQPSAYDFSHKFSSHYALWLLIVYIYIGRLGVSSHLDKTEKGLEELTQQSDCKTIIFKYYRPKQPSAYDFSHKFSSHYALWLVR
jgi:cobalamin biosynthesis protein CbiG